MRTARRHPGRQAAPPTARKSQRARRPRGRDRQNASADWTVLIYLAGDVRHVAASVGDDLAEILAVGGSTRVQVAVQHDGPDGATRYLLPARSAPGLKPIEVLGQVDSGSAEVLAGFLRWGMRVCPAERMALVLGGISALDPRDEDRKATGSQARVFRICRDEPADGSLDVVELGTVIRTVLAEERRSQIELLAIDSCDIQFLELAYELEGSVQVLLAPQTSVPGFGWNYTEVLQAWHQAAQQAKGRLDTASIAHAILPVIYASYRTDPGSGPVAVSALDLRRLDEVLRTFDSLCMNFMQVLGEGLIWKARKLLVKVLEGAGDRDGGNAFDGGSLFVLLATCMDAMADEACQGWLGTTLERAHRHSLAEFRQVLALSLERRLTELADPERARLWIQALNPDNPPAPGQAFLNAVGESVQRQVDSVQRLGYPNAELEAAQCLARQRDQELEAITRDCFQFLPTERRLDFEHMKEAAQAARRLAALARKAAKNLLGRLDSPGQETDPTLVASQTAGRLVLRSFSSDDGRRGWPRWSGVSVYRPPRLDALMDDCYQRFAFHQRVHWAALLGAANLIDDHPRALWRLINSLLSTGPAHTRREVLRRLTGDDSVIWGLRGQFQVLAPAPTLTLSLERRREAGPVSASAPGSASTGSKEVYVLRLESITRGAVVTEQQSQVQSKVMDRALQELQAILRTDHSDGSIMRRLRAIGGLLGEDIFQALGSKLDEERQLALAEGAGGTAHLQLQIPRELMRYPWELLHHQGEWLSERFAIGRQVFMETGLSRRVPLRRQGRVRPLVIGDPVFDPDQPYPQLPGARAEAEQVADWFERLQDESGDLIQFDRKRDVRVHTRLTTAEFRDLLRHGDDRGYYDIVHFAGHGLFREQEPETSAWLLSDGRLWALEIRNTLFDHPAPPWLIYANACESAMDSDQPPRGYQGNVFGLATAFINSGVAAYIAPLWPIDDAMAQMIALEFYRGLLFERATLGESLRRAKRQARSTMYPSVYHAYSDDASGPGNAAIGAGLSWASLVLYGDPTEDLFQALAGASRPTAPERAARGFAAAAPAGPPAGERSAAAPYLHAPDHLLQSWLSGPGLTPVPEQPPTRAAIRDAQHVAELELVEEAGLRRWRIHRPDHSVTQGHDRGALRLSPDVLPGSRVAELLADDRFRRQLPGRRGVIRTVGRWSLSKLADGLAGLGRAYDRAQVATEGLVMIPAAPARSLRLATPEAFAGQGDASTSNRILLLLHGTFSRSASLVDGLGAAFFAWAQGRYRAVLGLDHWTLSRTPKENAAFLLEQFSALAPTLLKGHQLDIVAHSRGGLVARSFCELLGQEAAVKHLIFVGTPNCGTDLANPRHWGALADLLVNLTGMGGAKPLAELAGLLAVLAAHGVEAQLPGLAAQNPETAGEAGSFLHELQSPPALASTVRLGVIAAEFEPLPLFPNFRALWKTAKSLGLDLAMDGFFGQANDLVVNTPHAWCIDQPCDQSTHLPPSLSPDRVLVFTPPKASFSIPAGVQREIQLGVHHGNLFEQSQTREALKRWLSSD